MAPSPAQQQQQKPDNILQMHLINIRYRKLPATHHNPLCVVRISVCKSISIFDTIIILYSIFWREPYVQTILYECK